MATYLVDFLNIFVGLRKTIVMLLLMVIGVVFTVKGLITGGNFVDLFKAVTISYFGANGIEHFTSMVQTHLQSKMGNMAPAVIDSVGEEK